MMKIHLKQPIYNFSLKSFNKMKPKKKLIYKLYDDIQCNPFRYIEQESMRNTGIKSYDFNKLRATRTISLYSFKKQQSTKQEMFIKSGQINHKIKTKNQEHFIGLKNQQILQNHIHENKNIKNEDDNNIIINSKNFKRIDRMIEGQLVSKQDNQKNIDKFNNQCKTQIKLINKHQKTLSLPIIQKNYQINLVDFNVNNTKQQELTTINSIQNLNQTKQLTQQIKARYEILRQILNKKQQRLNIQILKSIKMKNNKNLSRIPKSQSQVLKIDKWKEKYQKSTQHQKLSNQKINRNKILTHNTNLKLILPSIQQQSQKIQQEIQKVIITEESIKLDKLQKKLNAQQSSSKKLQNHQNTIKNQKKIQLNIQKLLNTKVFFDSSPKEFLHSTKHKLNLKNINVQHQYKSQQLMKQKIAQKDQISKKINKSQMLQNKNTQIYKPMIKGFKIQSPTKQVPLISKQQLRNYQDSKEKIITESSSLSNAGNKYLFEQNLDQNNNFYLKQVPCLNGQGQNYKKKEKKLKLQKSENDNVLNRIIQGKPQEWQNHKDWRYHDVQDYSFGEFVHNHILTKSQE